MPSAQAALWGALASAAATNSSLSSNSKRVAAERIGGEDAVPIPQQFRPGLCLRRPRGSTSPISLHTSEVRSIWNSRVAGTSQSERSASAPVIRETR